MNLIKSLEGVVGLKGEADWVSNEVGPSWRQNKATTVNIETIIL